MMTSRLIFSPLHCRASVRDVGGGVALQFPDIAVEANQIVALGRIPVQAGAALKSGVRSMGQAARSRARAIL